MTTSSGWHPTSEELAVDPDLLHYEIDGLRLELGRLRAALHDIATFPHCHCDSSDVCPQHVAREALGER